MVLRKLCLDFTLFPIFFICSSPIYDWLAAFTDTLRGPVQHNCTDAVLCFTYSVFYSLLLPDFDFIFYGREFINHLVIPKMVLRY